LGFPRQGRPQAALERGAGLTCRVSGIGQCQPEAEGRNRRKNRRRSRGAHEFYFKLIKRMPNLTAEQIAIIESSGNIKINAVAGSGKTSTLIEYAKKRKNLRRILYIAFNRSVRQEAIRRFEQAGISNVDVQTAHSLAFRHMVAGRNIQIAPNGYRAHEIREILSLKPVSHDPHSAHAVASHVRRFCSLFCNQATRRVDELDYLPTIDDEHAAVFAKRFYDIILKETRLFLAKMDSNEIPVTHEFYLKKFQLAKPALSYDCILFDEGQDASPVMIDLFLSQPVTRVIVGDMHQQIYGWRWAVNALGQVDFLDLPLTTSFRFGKGIADLAMACLAWKRHFTEYKPVVIHGKGGPDKTKLRATIARTNLTLLRAAINAVSHKGGPSTLYFEGNLNSYTYAAEGASLYDVLDLYLDKKDKIRDPLVKSMGSFGDLEDYADSAADPELDMLIDVVREYGRNLPLLISMVRKRHVSDEQRSTAKMIFSTVHRCKGMEYDTVTLEDDFINEKRIMRMIEKDGLESIDKSKLAEEVNLVYVAATRARRKVEAPDELFPDHAPSQPAKTWTPGSLFKGATSSWLAQKREKHENAYTSWSAQDDRELVNLAMKGTKVKLIAEYFGRRPSAIRARLKKLGVGG
jgi:F-box protein, helicase, 18